MSKTPLTTEGFDCFWEYAAKRQQIYWRQQAGQGGQLTDDSILATYRFTNVYRATDRVSQYVINQVQANYNGDWLNTFARTLTFKFFNRIDTWEYLTAQLGEINVQHLFNKQIDSTLEKIADQQPIYNPAYIMPPPNWLKGPKFKRHLELIRLMINDKVHYRIQAASSMEEGFKILRSYSSIGDFLAYQLIIDLNYSTYLNFNENEFVVAGPGARRGLRKCFVQTTSLTPSELIIWTAKRQYKEFTQRNLPWKNLYGRPLQLVDIQNIFCEVDKYTRLARPQLTYLVAGKRPKQFYRPLKTPQTANFPMKWDLKV